MKRKVHTDALDTLGTILETEEHRDAIHLGVEPVVAGDHLERGEFITLRNGKAYASHPDEALGIVDPFLTGGVRSGESFWLVVLPRKITSLRHVWTHPDFDEVEDKVKDEVDVKWAVNVIQDVADRLSMPFDDLLDQLIDPDNYRGEAFTVRYWDAYGDFNPEILRAVKCLTGFEPKTTPYYFSCSC